MDRDILLPHSDNIEEVFFKKRVKMLISFLIPSILFEYGGKRNAHHIKKPQNNIHQVKGERRRKRRICLQSIFIFYEFF